MKTITNQTRTISVTNTQFEELLETCLTIKQYPNRRQPYYVCEFTSTENVKSIIRVYIKK